MNKPRRQLLPALVTAGSVIAQDCPRAEAFLGDTHLPANSATDVPAFRACVADEKGSATMQTALWGKRQPQLRREGCRILSFPLGAPARASVTVHCRHRWVSCS